MPQPPRATVAVRRRLGRLLAVVAITLTAVGLHQLTLDHTERAATGYHDAVLAAPDTLTADLSAAGSPGTSSADPAGDRTVHDDGGHTAMVVACLLALAVLIGCWLRQRRPRRLLYLRPRPLAPSNIQPARWRTALTLTELSLSRT